MVRIGFVGVGAMGQCAHLANYIDLPGCEAVAISELREGLGRQVAARYGVGRVYRDHREMLEREQIDAIVASQPFERHGKLLPSLYEAGLPMLTEKPLARSFDVGSGLIQSLAKSRARHVLGYHKRSDPATVYAMDLIQRFRASGEIGRLQYVRILMPAGDWQASGFAHLIQSNEPIPTLDEDAPPQDLSPDWQERLYVFVNYYIHQVNLMRHLMGELYDVDYADPAGIVMAVRSRSGISGVIEMTPYRTRVDWQEEALIAFERGYIRLQLPAPLVVNRPGRVEVLRDAGEGAVPEETRPHLPWVHAMRRQAENFVRHVQGESPPLCDAREALDDLRIARDYINLLRAK